MGKGLSVESNELSVARGEEFCYKQLNSDITRGIVWLALESLICFFNVVITINCCFYKGQNPNLTGA